MEEAQSQAPIEAPSGQNSGYWQKNGKYWLVAGIIVVLAVGGYFLSKNQKPAEEQEQAQEQTEEQADGNDLTSADEENQNENLSLNQDSNLNENTSNIQSEGDVVVTGTLELSDDLSRGNLMIRSHGGRIYIATRRDFSALLGRAVNLSVRGNIESFTFLGLSEAGRGAEVAVTRPEASQPEVAAANAFELSGTLANSDDLSRGNYQILSGRNKVYLLSKRDYSSLLGAEVRLNAQGSIDSFTEARLVKK